LRKLFLSALFAAALGIGTAQAAEVVVRVAPPRVVVETRGSAPSHQHVWIGGYHRWDGNAYVWEKGRWEAPPRAGAHWVAPRWNHRHDGYVFVEGRWR
jgi:opacity protein-like surface antigen